jgi:hypothetical protein
LACILLAVIGGESAEEEGKRREEKERKLKKGKEKKGFSYQDST